MRQKSRGTAKATKARTEAQRAGAAARAAKVQRVQMTLGYGIVVLCAVGGFFISLPVGIGLAILAGFRLYILRKELRRQAAEETDDASAPHSPSAGTRPKPVARTAAGRAS